MKKIAFTLFVAGAVFATEASAQVMVRASSVPPGQRPPDGMCRVWIEGVPAGRQPRATDCATARASAPPNSRVIYGSDAPFPGRAVGRFRDGNCDFERRPSNLGDLFFGLRDSQRGMDRDCRVSSSRTRDHGVWYPVGRDANGNVIYERRVRDRNGRTVVERARSRDGRTLSRIAANGDSRKDRVKATEKARRDREKVVRKAQKDREKAIERARREAERDARGNNGKGRGNGRDG
ncbi:MAG: hypothetical protein ACR2GJ_00625 [Gemmatimonadaceae bacterium]